MITPVTVQPHPTAPATLPVVGVAADDVLCTARKLRCSHIIKAGWFLFVTADRQPVCESCSGRRVYWVPLKRTRKGES